MNKLLENNIISQESTILQALERLSSLGLKSNLTLFIINKNEQLVGTLTDGDIRRKMIKGAKINNSIQDIMKRDFSFLSKDDIDYREVIKFKNSEIFLVPILDEEKRIVEIINLKFQKAILPLDAIIMAGGEGKRLNPLTLNIPKPLLIIGKKPILQYSIERLVSYGIKNISLSVNYLKNQIIDYFKDGKEFQANINYIHEKSKLGTIGSATLTPHFFNDYVLVMNSDLLTNIDLEDFFLYFLNNSADMAIATIPYKVKVPYAILNTDGNNVRSFEEKPTKTYYSNAGIYLMKKEVLSIIPPNVHYDATDLMNEVIKKKMKLISFPILGYWLDIGKPEDFEKAQNDIRHIKFSWRLSI